MDYFIIDFTKVIQVALLGKEQLKMPTLHKERYINEYIMYVITSGKLLLENNGKRLELLAGDAYIFNKGDYQKPLCSTDCEYYYLHFDADCKLVSGTTDDYLEKIRNKNINLMKSSLFGYTIYENFKIHILQSMHFEAANLKYIVDKLSENKLKNVGCTLEKRLEISHNLEKMFISIEQMCECGYNTNTKNLRVYNQVKEIYDYISENYYVDIGIREIEKRFSINFDYANRIFKRIMGESIIRFRNNRRIERAKYLLLNTQKDINDIAFEVGFNDKYYFCKYFTKTQGVSPISFKGRKTEYDL